MPTRLDVWLDVACIFKTRSEAQRACKGGKVLVNGHRGKPHRDVNIGDAIELTMPGGRKRQLVVSGIADRHLPKTEARALYEDLTPPPSAEEQELRDLLRRAGPVPGSRSRGQGSPGRRDRRVRRRMKGTDQ